MMGHTLISDDQTLNTCPSSLLAFCVDSFNTCFSGDADKLCVSIAVSCVSALLLLLSCLVLMCQRCKFRGKNPGEAAAAFYCFVGNLCCTIGAILSRQLHIQILMGAFACAMDFVNFISSSFLYLCWNSETDRRLRMMRRRRRQHLLGMCVLMAFTGVLKVNHSPTESPLNSRRLLQIPVQDNIGMLGYILGLLSFVIACTSRFPAMHRAYGGQMMTKAQVFSGVLCSLSAALYASAILLYNTQFGFVLRVMPWLLSAVCCTTLDLLTLIIHWFRKGTKQKPVRFSPDTESLLGLGSPTKNAALKTKRKQQVGLLKTNVQKMTEMGCYMEVSVQPAKKICRKEVTVCGEGTSEDQALDRTVKMIRDDGFCSSASSCDSIISSDLEVGRLLINQPSISRDIVSKWR
ncbi:hypothetical protein LDENG_00182260 [Lucifuga dentata]|nr:hypothetical protein LDENG_00182260 [Lucifuga dentata]